MYADQPNVPKDPKQVRLEATQAEQDQYAHSFEIVNKELLNPEPGTLRFELSEDYIKAHIRSIHYFKVEDMYKAAGIESDKIPLAAANMTICHIVTNLGQLFEGKSFCIDRRAYDIKKGETAAYLNALSKLAEYISLRLKEEQFKHARDSALAEYGTFR